MKKSLKEYLEEVKKIKCSVCGKESEPYKPPGKSESVFCSYDCKAKREGDWKRKSKEIEDKIRSKGGSYVVQDAKIKALKKEKDNFMLTGKLKESNLD